MSKGKSWQGIYSDYFVILKDGIAKPFYVNVNCRMPNGMLKLKNKYFPILFQSYDKDEARKWANEYNKELRNG